MMSSATEIDLTDAQRAALLDVFAQHGQGIDLVGVYGSRVQGKARPGSDVDLVVYGSLSERDEARIRLAIEDSDLSIFADVRSYDRISHAPLKAQIDYWMKPLFTRDDLLVGVHTLKAA